jgi:hypothetical protein
VRVAAVKPLKREVPITFVQSAVGKMTLSRTKSLIFGGGANVISLNEAKQARAEGKSLDTLKIAAKLRYKADESRSRGGKKQKMKKYKCPCCGNRTLESERFFYICDICGWEDDNIQRDDPAFWGGANSISLNLAREVWTWQRPCECPLCGYKTLYTKGQYEKCEVCGWIDDPAQTKKQDNLQGTNPMTFRFARRAWRGRQSFGTLSGKGWDESYDPEKKAWEPGREPPYDLLPCPCCGNPTFLTRYNEDHACCDWCEWIDDKAQEENPDLPNGRNKMSLNQARETWKEREK